MTFALTKVRAYGVEAEEVVNKRYLQHLILTITAANTDTDLDLGDHVAGSLGTFWDAVDGTATGLVGLAAIRDIATRADAFIGIGGTGLNGYVEAKNDVLKFDSAATAGGAATETLTVTGLLTTDTILSVTPFQKAGTSANTPIIDYGDASGNCTVADQLPVEFLGNPGAGAKVRVAVKRAAVTPSTGTYLLSMGTMAPNLTFLSGNAPTAYLLCLSWVLKDKEEPVSAYSAA